MTGFYPLRFQSDAERHTPESWAAQFCSCEKAQVRLSIEDACVHLDCAACGKPMNDWFQENVQMAPIPVSYEIHPGHCTCNMMLQTSCDCDQWPVITPLPEGESMNNKEAPGA